MKPAKNRAPAQKAGRSGGHKAKVKASPAPAPKESTLAPKQAAFVREYLIDLNATQAAIRAGYSAKTAYAAGERLLRHVEVAALLKKAMADRAERNDIKADRVIKEAWSIMTADPREFMEYRIGCCRYCWGEGYRYQRTTAEFESAEASYAAHCEAQIDAGKPIAAEFDPKGGPGFNKVREPNPECPECAGEGEGRTVFKDTRTVSKAAASLFAGVKETKDGIEIKLHSKDAAMDKMFRHLGLYNDKIELTMPRVRVKDFTGKS